MRLYTEHTRHEQRSREEVKRSRAMYQENVVRRRMGLSKVSTMHHTCHVLLINTLSRCSSVSLGANEIMEEDVLREEVYSHLSQSWSS